MDAARLLFVVPIVKDDVKTGRGGSEAKAREAISKTTSTIGIRTRNDDSLGLDGAACFGK